MWAFRIERGGYSSQADESERRIVKGLANDVVYMLGERMSELLEGRNQAEFDAVVDPFAGYEAELSQIAESIDADLTSSTPEESSSGNLPMDEALLHLLPDMSEDPEIARDLRNITQDSIARRKAENLALFYSTLDGESDAVHLTNDDVPHWLAAINDIRIVVAARLKIVDDASAEQAFSKAATMMGDAEAEGIDPIDSPDDLLAVLYSMLTWWEESLLLAVGNKARRK